MNLTKQLLNLEDHWRQRSIQYIKTLGVGHGARYNGQTVRDEVNVKSFAP